MSLPPLAQYAWHSSADAAGVKWSGLFDGGHAFARLAVDVGDIDADAFEYGQTPADVTGPVQVIQSGEFPVG